MGNVKFAVAAFVIGSCLLGGVTTAISQVAYHLDQATADQCRTNSWPEHQHDTHIEWCIDNGYSVTN